MTALPIVGGLIALAVAVALWRLRRSSVRRLPRSALNVAAGLLLYLLLFPPATRVAFDAGTLTVLTPGASAAQLAALSTVDVVVALPDAPPLRGSERVPDLAAALRRHPLARRLVVIGDGLPSRDRDAARGLVERFDAAPLPRGVVELAIPASVRAGNTWRVGGRVEGVPQGRVELRDPGQALVASGALDADGRFELRGLAKTAGRSRFALRVVDRDGVRVDDVGIPLSSRANVPLKVILTAGAPDADVKYLRRWAIDAGVDIDAKIALTEGVALNQGSPGIAAEALQAADVVIIDERAFAALDANARAALHTAVDEDLGLLLRVTGPVPDEVATDWAALGFHVQAAESVPAAGLRNALGLDEGAAPFMRRPIEVHGDDATPLLRADDGSAVALWRVQGAGRVGIWWLADSYRAGLGGAAAAFGSLWSDALSTLSRARAASDPVLPQAARVDQRASLCGLHEHAAVAGPDGKRVPLVVDPSGGARRCAAYWPADAGWHTLLDEDVRHDFSVRARDEADALTRGEDQRATQVLVAASGAAVATQSQDSTLPRWPFFIGWLAVVALLWWIERRVPRAHPER